MTEAHSPSADREQAMALEQTAGARVLDRHAVIRVEGDDALTWLQGQLTSDVSGLEDGGHSYGLILTPKGRVLTDCYAFRRSDSVILTMRADRVAPVMERLDRYVIMEDVELVDSPQPSILTVSGPRSDELQAKLDASISSSEGGGPYGTFKTRRLDAPGFDWLVDKAQLEAARAALDTALGEVGGQWVSEAVWDRVRVRRGIPELGRDFGEQTYPQEAALKGRAISFTKGCYLGQEVVSMLEHRGKLSKFLALFRATSAPEGTLTEGAEITGPDGEPAGQLTSVTLDPDHPSGVALIALGYLKRPFALDPQPGSLRCRGATLSVERVLAGESDGGHEPSGAL